MMRRTLFFAVVILISAFPAAVRTEGGPEGGNDLTLTFNISQNVEQYEASDWGEPAQAAIWLEDPETKKTKTVWVTYRTATGNFLGKVECPNSLPAWIGVFRKEFGRDDYPTPRNPAPDAVTGATIKAANFSVKTTVPAGTTWNYYIEINVSGDFNGAFSTFTSDGRPDQYGCGQPSIVYKGTIRARRGSKSTPSIIGRTHRMIRSTEIIPDLTGIESAKNLYENIEVVCE